MGYAEAQYTVDEVINALQNMGANESGIPPIKPWVTVVPAAQSVKVYFTIKDTVIENQTVCHCKGVMIRKKLGSPITSLTDGDLVGIYEDDAAKNHGQDGTPITVSGLENGVWVWIGVWAYSDHNVYNLDMSNVYQVQPGVDIIYGFHQDFTDLNPLTSITYIGANANFEPMYTRAERNGVKIAIDSNSTVYSDFTYSTPALRKSFTRGSWGMWSWLSKNQPFLLIERIIGDTSSHNYSREYKAWKRLDPNNYNIDAETGKPINFADVPYGWNIFGYFAWFPKIYIKEVYDSGNIGRTVYFSETKLTSATSDFVLRSFKDKNGHLVEGLWLGMSYFTPYGSRTMIGDLYTGFGQNDAQYKVYLPKIVSYGTSSSLQNYIVVNQNPSNSSSNVNYTMAAVYPGEMKPPEFKNLIRTITKDKKVAFFGGSFSVLVRDILYLLYKTTDIQEASGYGMSISTGHTQVYGGTNTGISGLLLGGNHTYANVGGNGYYPGSILPDSKYLEKQNGFMVESIRYNGGFYGIDASYICAKGSGSQRARAASFGYGKLFHSFALGSYIYTIIDFNLAVKNNRLFVNSTGLCDLNDSAFNANYVSKNYYFPSTKSKTYPSRLKLVDNEFGSLPDYENGANAGSSTTGLCDVSDNRVNGDKDASYVENYRNAVLSVPAIYTYATPNLDVSITTTSIPSYTPFGNCISPSNSGPGCLYGLMNMDDTIKNSSGSDIESTFSYIFASPRVPSSIPMIIPETNYTPYN